jgi:hypothetical protein
MDHTRKRKFSLIFCFVLWLGGGSTAFATTPLLNFSDLTSGPDTGLGDGLGSGVIVTVWGQNLGSEQGNSNISFTDAKGTERDAAHVYYWKNADGELPSGPSNLFASHAMQEIAFSIPDSAMGAGSIKVTVNGQVSNLLPFTVRSGPIFHVASGGSDADSGSFSAPWQTTQEVVDSAPAGSTVYVHDVDSGGNSSVNGFYWNNAGASSTLAEQFALVSYPGYQPKITGQRGVTGYNTDALVISKMDIYASNYLQVGANDQPTGSTIDFKGTWGIRSTRHGRAVGNRVGDIPGGCASKYQGAISGTAQFYDSISLFKMFGNEIYEYGCAGSSKLHHTTYFTVRSAPDNRQVEPWELGWNYLHDNKAKNGLHQFDQDTDCGDITGPVRIHDNVIVNQASAGIAVASQCGWTADFYLENNVLINVGNASAWDGVDPNTADAPELAGINIRDSGYFGTVYIRNNLIYGWTTDGSDITLKGAISFYGSASNVTAVIDNNIVYSEIDHPFIVARNSDVLSNLSGSNNIWYFSGSAPTNALSPNWDTDKYESDPLLILSGARVNVAPNSDAVGNAKPITAISHDVYGKPRFPGMDIGPVEFFTRPLAPGNVTIH